MPVVGNSKTGKKKSRRRRGAKKEKEEPVDLTEPQLVDSPIFWGLDPLLGRNIFSMFITDIINIIVYPCTVSILAWFFDLTAFFLFPFLGGFLGASSFLSFNRDPLTYHYAKLTQIDLYKMGMIFIKDALYSFLGRPTFFDNEQERKVYIPPQKAKPLNLEGITEEDKKKENEAVERVEEAIEITN